MFSGIIQDGLPIYLSTVDCGIKDNAIINCDRNARLGLTNCDHSQDVYVHCEGE